MVIKRHLLHRHKQYQAKKKCKQANISTAKNANSKLKFDNHAINAGEIAAFTAVIAAGFLFSRFCFFIREKGLLLAKNETLDIYTLELAKITHSIEFVAALLALFSVIFAFFSVMVKHDIDKLKEKLEATYLQKGSHAKKSSRIKHFVVACILFLAATIVFAFRAEIKKVSPDIQSYIMLALLFVLISIIIIRGKLTTLAFYSASYLAFCTLFTFIYLAVTKH